ncbi:MAG: MBL fold metallo-hydrolase [Acidiferrobacterales bacterium]
MGRCLAGLWLVLWLPATYAASCGTDGVWVQVLGRTHAETKRASSSHLLWLNGKARVLIDVGGGSAGHFAKSSAKVADLDVILFTQLHVNHTADLPALLQASLLEGRTRPLPIYGPTRSKLMPSTVTFVRTLFDKKRGVYRYLGELVSPLGKTTYKLQPRDVRIKASYAPNVYVNERVRVGAATITRSPIPTLAWRVQAAGKFIVFSSAANNGRANLASFAQGADLLVIHDPDRELANAAPAAIARMAQQRGVKKLALIQFVGEQQSLAAISGIYKGPTSFVRDLDCFQP